MTDLSMPAHPGNTVHQASNLAVAVALGHRMLATPNDAGIREALRILLRAIEQDTVRRSVDAQFPIVAASLATPPQRASRPAPEVLRLRMRMRAAHYNPDLPHEVQALETVAGIWPGHLADVVAGRAPLDHRIPQQTLNRILSIAATGPMPRRAVTS
ncbi:hypothetical protein [Streptomyces formicae]